MGRNQIIITLKNTFCVGDFLKTWGYLIFKAIFYVGKYGIRHGQNFPMEKQKSFTLNMACAQVI